MGLAWAIPVEDVLAMIIAIGLFIPFWRKLKVIEKSPSVERCHWYEEHTPDFG